MKTNMLLVVFLIVVSGAAFGQDKHTSYWVIETNRDKPNGSIVRLYDDTNQLLNEIKVDKTLDIAKRRHKRKVEALVKNYNERLTAGSKNLRSKSSI